ncbi:MAG: hypothetical protein A2945_03210 [Candidatus Liptonbacteria bacterium RIFCSPLOWO2_01_FULL_52_25]|uniref:Inositolphosphotransferase Aur1/Ipt1 domain-containing protein n=1 Tax=Candidatus Liptonbacteria bacterium RIFCSPLOWO2_01_FULL_52_25 TaxID=1798650 RepID=A0A1G2CE07_9BACT|nr:MAG: hypothetical protein A2945_03210 [Candidatus Liptonbacteria bacterium RIFCSPLOWO2_01_FULL_52_25]
MKRVAILAGGYIYFLLVYFGTSYFAAGRYATIVRWDPVWYFPTISAFTVTYMSVYFVPLFLIVVVKDTRELLRLAYLFAVVITFCGIIFLIMPLTLPRPPIEQGGILNKLLAWQYSIDRPSNMFPSIHIAVSLLVAFVAGTKKPSYRWWVLAWVLLIAMSTLFIKQHYVVDIVGGVVVALAGWHIFHWLVSSRVSQYQEA